MSKVLQERGFRGLPHSTEPNPRDHVKSISTTKADSSKIRCMGCSLYAVLWSQHRSVFSKTDPFLRRLQDYCYDNWREAQDVKILEAYDHTLPHKEKDPMSFTLPCFIHNIWFDKALVDLGESEKSLYDSWNSRMEHCIENGENGRMILSSVQNGPLIWPTVTEVDGDDLIACFNKAMAFLTAIASLRVIVEQVERRQGKSYFGTGYKGNATSSRGNNTSGQEKVVKCYNCQCEGHMARQYTQPKRLRNAAWFKDKALLAAAQEAGQI
uniref:CCHC-type domain-containing protein n=1 Tax=Tanacetum cinerariifolium TaxID=118510 RepID=A0A6L2KH68_TANCI|nr:hypothetical protein [Tanacetum cinerariifolium]